MTTASAPFERVAFYPGTAVHIALAVRRRDASYLQNVLRSYTAHRNSVILKRYALYIDLYYKIQWFFLFHRRNRIKIKLVPWGTDGRLPLSDLHLDLGSGHTAYRRASLIDLYLRTKFHWDRTKIFFESHHWGFGQVQSHVTQKLGQISKIRPDQI